MGLPLLAVLAIESASENPSAKPALFVQGERDEFGGRVDIEDFVQSFEGPKDLVVIPGSDHLFTGNSGSSRPPSTNGFGISPDIILRRRDIFWKSSIARSPSSASTAIPARLEDLLGAFKKNVPCVSRTWSPRGSRKSASASRASRSSSGNPCGESERKEWKILAARMVEAARASDFKEVEVILTHMGMELDWLLRILDENRCSGNL